MHMFSVSSFKSRPCDLQPTCLSVCVCVSGIAVVVGTFLKSTISRTFCRSLLNKKVFGVVCDVNIASGTDTRDGHTSLPELHAGSISSSVDTIKAK